MALSPLEPLSLSRPRQRRQAAPKLDEATAASMIERLAGALGSGLQYAGETLDKPGRAVRGLLAGRPDQLAALIPFSDTMGLTDPRTAVSGRDLLEKAGLLGANTPGLDLGDVAGFGAELATDPLSWIVGPGKALAKGMSAGKAYKQGGKLLAPGVSPTRVIEELASGRRGLIGLKVPFAKEPFAIFGTGAKAAKAAEFGYYNPLTRAVRQMFDYRLGGMAVTSADRKKLGAAEKMLHKSLDTATAARFDELANYQAHMESIAKQLPQVQELWDDIYKAFPTVAPQNFEEAMRNATEAKGLTYMQDLVAGAMKGANPNVASAPTMITRAMRQQLYDMGLTDDVIKTLTPAQAWEHINGASIPDAIKQSEMFQKAAQFDQLAGQLTGLQNSAYKSIRDLGINGKELDDLIAHTARQRNPILGASGLGRGRTGTGFPYATRRKEPLRRLNTTTINRITTDPRVTATHDVSKEGIEQAAKYLNEAHGVPLSVPIKTRGGKTRNFKQARALAKAIAVMPQEILNSGGLFPRSTALDAMDYLKHATVIRGSLSAVHDMVHKFASPQAIGPTVETLFKNLGLSTKGAESGLANWYKTFSARTGSNAPLAGLRVPSELAEAAGKTLSYHREPEKVLSLLKLADKYTGLFKASLTLPFPAFHSRNFVSGMWQNAVTAFRTPGLARRAMSRLQDAVNGKDPELLNKLKIYGILPDSMSRVRDLFNDQTIQAGTKAPRFRDLFNPLTPARRAAANVRGGYAAGGPKGAVKQFASGLGQWGSDANQAVEFFNRGTHFIARLEDGWEPALAARSTKLAHFDYSELSPFEKGVMKRLIPFYAFSRKNLPLQLRELFNRPGGPTAQTIRAMVDARQATSGKDAQANFTPKWLGEGLSFRLQGGDERDAKFFSESGLLPVSEAFNRFPTINGRPDARMITENVLGMANPIISGPLQAFTGRQFWSHRDLDELAQTPFDEPMANFWLYQSPVARAVATGRMLADERKTAKEKAFNALLGGARFTDVDLKKAINFQLRDVLERELKQSAGVGEFKRLYARDLERISPQSQAQLSLLVQLLQEYKQMQAEDQASGRAKPKQKAAK